MRFLRSESPLRCLRPCIAREHFRCTRVLGGTPLRHYGRRENRNRPLQICSLKGVDTTDFEEEVLKAEIPVLIDFWAEWCGPCKLLDSSMEWLEKEYEGELKVLKLETDKSPSIIEKYKIYGLPTIVLFRDGQVMEGSKREGAITRDGLVEYLADFGIVQNSTKSS